MSPLPLITQIFSRFLSASILPYRARRKFDSPLQSGFRPLSGMLFPSAARLRLSRRDNRENPLEFGIPSGNTHRRQNLIAELQVDVKLTHTEGECVMLGLSRLLWVVLLGCFFLALGSGCAEAREG